MWSACLGKGYGKNCTLGERQYAKDRHMGEKASICGGWEMGWGRTDGQELGLIGLENGLDCVGG
jgi:hypothetical protein